MIGAQYWYERKAAGLGVRFRKAVNALVGRMSTHWNSVALVVDQPILDLLKIGSDTTLDISTDGKQLIIGSGEGLSGVDFGA